MKKLQPYYKEAVILKFISVFEDITKQMNAQNLRNYFLIGTRIPRCTEMPLLYKSEPGVIPLNPK